MSETVHYRGKLHRVENYGNETVEEQCKRLVGVEGIHESYDSYEEYLLDEYYQQFVVVGDTLYRVEKEEVDPESDIFRFVKHSEEEIEFEVRYYNGGCSFDEAIGYALEKNCKGSE